MDLAPGFNCQTLYINQPTINDEMTRDFEESIIGQEKESKVTVSLFSVYVIHFVQRLDEN
jgi:hypothetical protein